MAVNRAVTAENNDNVGVVRGCWRTLVHSALPTRWNFSTYFGDISRPKNGGSAHETEVLSELRVACHPPSLFDRTNCSVILSKVSSFAKRRNWRVEGP